MQKSALTFSVMQDNYGKIEHKGLLLQLHKTIDRLPYCKRFALGKGTATSDLAITVCHREARKKQCDAKNCLFIAPCGKLSVHMRLKEEHFFLSVTGNCDGQQVLHYSGVKMVSNEGH